MGDEDNDANARHETRNNGVRDVFDVGPHFYDTEENLYESSQHEHRQNHGECHDAPFEIGQAQVLKEGNDVTIVATGHLVWEAMRAALALDTQGIRAEVVNVHTIKPLDGKTIIDSATRTGCVVTAEEHQRIGGLGSQVAQLLASHLPVPMEQVAVNDSFGESGTPGQLMEKYGLNSEAILQCVETVMSRSLKMIN